MEADIKDVIATRFSGAVGPLRVGEAGDIMYVHESLLKKTSRFFRAALDEKWREGSTLDIAMPMDDLSIIAGYIQWLFSDGHVTPDAAEDDNYTEYLWLVKAYIFGDRIQDDQFCNQIISMIAETMDSELHDGRHYPGDTIDNLIYSSTLKSSFLRRIVVDIYAARGDAEMISDNFPDAPKEFLMELLVEMANQRPRLEFESVYERSHQWFK